MRKPASLLQGVLLLGCLVFAACTSSPPNADLVLKNGKVATVNDAFSIAEAVAILDNRIVYVGDNDGVESYIQPDTRVIDLEGKLVTPGLIDAHCHPYNLGKQDDEESFSVSGAQTYEEMVAMVAARVATMQPGEWLIGGGWSENDWPDKQLPIHDPLSAVTPDNPVFLYRSGGNSAFANARALEIAGIDANTPDPYGGKIARKPNGEPTGFVVNMGNNLIKAHFPDDRKPDAWYRAIYQEAARQANAVGLTGWHDAGNEPEHIAIYKQLVDRGELTVRANVMLQNPRLSFEETVDYFQQHRVVNYGGNHFLQVRSVKVFFDGALGSRGAAFYEPYTDDPGNTGVFEIRPDHLYDVARAGLFTGMQIAPHAIGMRGNGEWLDQFSRALQDHPVDDHRFRSEHAQIVRAQDVPRFVELGIIPSMQPIHATSDMSFVAHRIGPERAEEGAYIWRAFLDAGSVIASGSDFTVESHRPLWGFYAAVTRQDHEGAPSDGWYPEQRMSRTQALRSYTIWAAYAAFQEDVLGSIEVGKLADLVVFDQDILTIEPADILSTNVVYTIVDGNIVYQGTDG